MSWYKWNEIARGFADYVQQFRLVIQRGAVSVQLYYDDIPDDDEKLLVVGVFGNDNVFSDIATQELDMIRKVAGTASLVELGFGTSADNGTWAILIGEKKRNLSTAVGQNFRKEMLKIFLEELVWSAWRSATGEPATVESAGSQALS